MPGVNRHVHFNGKASPASSSSSWPSSGGPITPPPTYGYVPPHYPLHPTAESNGFVNPVLSPNNPTFDFNLTKPPTSMMDYASIPVSIWQQPATSPPVPSMAVVCEQLPWILNIPGNIQFGYVSVGDLVFGLYKALSTPVSQSEFLTLSPRGQHAVSKAFKNRCKVCFDSDEYRTEFSQGVKRVDFLVGFTKFSGVRPDKIGKWTLLVRADE
ncbi:hypothetical protein JR316_0012394 [Psilocybe cubensis]|uniref:Uncharacterized protein n=2 Tax=Psilocybe cubensis TaxID=181762 RepID=A0ACB8GI37_PSICU|nr:hypothetical protein JR316_0012394 [Psilocybe cubensis]KAH9475283.1 hypothetical protein JR316_0012394 [Psilocybe cubensis]